MPLPQKVIEQLGREPARTPGWSGRLLMASSTIFFVALALFIGVQFGYLPYLEGKVAVLQDELAGIGKSVSIGDHEKIISFASQLTNIKTLLDKRAEPSHLLDWLEQHTHVNVAFSRLEFDAATRTAKFVASARSAEDMVAQIQHFESQPEVQSATFEKLSATAQGFWEFDVTVIFTPEFFAPAPISSETALPSDSVPAVAEDGTSEPQAPIP